MTSEDLKTGAETRVHCKAKTLTMKVPKINMHQDNQMLSPEEGVTRTMMEQATMKISQN